MAMCEDEFDLPDADEYFPPSDDFDLPDAEDYFDALDSTVAAVKKTGPSVKLVYQGEDENEEDAAPQELVKLPPELLEEILLYLEPLEVYAVQRVCKVFDKTIRASVTLWEKMSFAPGPKRVWKHFVRAELNRLFTAESKSTLTKATWPCRVEVYATRAGPGIRIELSKGKFCICTVPAVLGHAIAPSALTICLIMARLGVRRAVGCCRVTVLPSHFRRHTLRPARVVARYRDRLVSPTAITACDHFKGPFLRVFVVDAAHRTCHSGRRDQHGQRPCVESL